MRVYYWCILVLVCFSASGKNVSSHVFYTDSLLGDKHWSTRFDARIQNIASLLDLLADPRLSSDKKRVFRIQQLLLAHYREIGDNYYAIEAITEMWNLYQMDTSLCSPEAMIMNLSELAMLHHYTENTNTAKYYATIILKLASARPSKVWFKYPYAVLGELSLDGKDYQRAKWYFKQCMGYARLQNDSPTLARCICSLMRADIYLGTTNNLLNDAEIGIGYGQHKNACKLLKSVISLNLSYYYLSIHAYKKALNKNNEAIRLLQNINSTDALKLKSELLDLKIQILKGQGNYSDMAEALQHQLQTKESIYHQFKNEIRLNHLLRYHINQTKKRLVQTEEKLHRFESSTKKKNVLIGSFCTVLIVLICLVISQLSLLKKVRKYNALLIRKNQVINTQRNQINLQREQLQDHVNRLEFENLITKYEIVKSQIDPHFLFNTFNLLKISITKSSKNAVSLVQHISEFYRSTLRTSDYVLSSLEDELQMIRSYVVIQSIRHHDCFLINTRIDSALLKHKIPTRSLQLVIENIFKHNELSKTKPILINIYHQDKHLVIENTIRAKLKMNTSSGYGQKNITKRYNLLSNAEPVFSETGSFYIVKLPLIKDEYERI